MEWLLRPAREHSNFFKYSLWSIDGYDLSILYQRDPIAQAGFIHVGRGDQYGNVLLLQSPQHFPEFFPRYGIDTGGRLVEKEYGGLVDEGAAQGEFLFHPSRKVFRQPGV